LRQAIDEVEDALDWPYLVREAEEEIRDAREIIQRYGSSVNRDEFSAMDRMIRETIGNRDPEVLRRKLDELSRLRRRTLRERSVAAIIQAPSGDA
jgi:molecular chaperone DnaK